MRLVNNEDGIGIIGVLKKPPEIDLRVKNIVVIANDGIRPFGSQQGQLKRT